MKKFRIIRRFASGRKGKKIRFFREFRRIRRMSSAFPVLFLVCSLSPKQSLSFSDAFWERLPKDSAQKAASFLQSRRRDSVLACYSLLEKALLRFSDVPLSISKLSHDSFGRPFFPDRPDIFLSLSHAPSGVACVLSSYPVGIDLEDFCQPLKDWEGLAEVSGFSGVSSADEFLSLWVMWESYFKFVGGRCSRPKALRSLHRKQFFLLRDRNRIFPAVFFLFRVSPSLLCSVCLPRGKVPPPPFPETIDEEILSS